MALNWWLVVVACIVAIVVIGLVFYLVILFGAEDDKNQAWFPKIIVIIGLSLACFNVLLLPYDVANRMDTSVASSLGGGINTVLVWQIIMYAIALFTFVLVPFAMFYYEARDSDQPNICNQLKPALAYTAIVVVVFLLLLIVLWLTLGTAVIPYTFYHGTVTMAPPTPSHANNGQSILSYSSTTSNEELDLKVSFFVYLVALMSAVGWVLFFIFGGVGLTAFPIDFLLMFKYRPIPITASDYALKRSEIARESERLIEEGKKLDEAGRSGTSRTHKKRVAAFKLQVQDLESYFERLEASFRPKGGEILRAYLALVIGIFGAVISLCWFVHIIINNIAKVNPFLAAAFADADNIFALFGVLLFGIFGFYLLWCVVKGCTKMGVNLLLFTVYPMKVNGTLMNAFLFNTMLILISSVSVVQFCAISFRDYAVNTSVDSLFSTYALRLKGIGYVLMYMQYPLLGVSVLAFLWLIICPNKFKTVKDQEQPLSFTPSKR